MTVSGRARMPRNQRQIVLMAARFEQFRHSTNRFARHGGSRFDISRQRRATL